MKTKVSKTVTLTEEQLAKLFGKDKLSFSVDNGYYDQRDGYAAPRKLTLSWTEEEELSAKL